MFSCANYSRGCHRHVNIQGTKYKDCIVCLFRAWCVLIGFPPDLSRHWISIAVSIFHFFAHPISKRLVFLNKPNNITSKLGNGLLDGLCSCTDSFFWFWFCYDYNKSIIDEWGGFRLVAIIVALIIEYIGFSQSLLNHSGSSFFVQNVLSQFCGFIQRRGFQNQMWW